MKGMRLLLSYLAPRVAPAIQRACLKVLWHIADVDAVVREAEARPGGAVRSLLQTFGVFLADDEAAEAAVSDALEGLARLAQRSSPIVSALYNAGAVLFVLTRIDTVRKGRQDTVSQAACNLLSAMCADKTHGAAVLEVVCDLTTAAFAKYIENKPKRLLEYFCSDHGDEANGRAWDNEARLRLSEFIASEVHDMQLRLSAIGDWAGTSKLYDYGRVRTLHPKKIVLPAAGAGGGGGGAVDA